MGHARVDIPDVRHPLEPVRFPRAHIQVARPRHERWRVVDRADRHIQVLVRSLPIAVLEREADGIGSERIGLQKDAQPVDAEGPRAGHRDEVGIGAAHDPPEVVQRVVNVRLGTGVGHQIPGPRARVFVPSQVGDGAVDRRRA